MTVFVDARNVLNSKNIQDISPNEGNESVPQHGGRRLRYLLHGDRPRRRSVPSGHNGDLILDWVPVNDPRVFEEGRNVRMGVSVTF